MSENMYDAWDNGDRHEIRQQFAERDAQNTAELRRLREEIALLRGDPGNRYAHRLAIELECALLAPEQANADLLDEYHTAVREWMEANGQPYVSGFGKD